MAAALLQNANLLLHAFLVLSLHPFLQISQKFIFHLLITSWDVELRVQTVDLCFNFYLESGHVQRGRNCFAHGQGDK